MLPFDLRSSFGIQTKSFIEYVMKKFIDIFSIIFYVYVKPIKFQRIIWGGLFISNNQMDLRFNKKINKGLKMIFFNKSNPKLLTD